MKSPPAVAPRRRQPEDGRAASALQPHIFTCPLVALISLQGELCPPRPPEAASKPPGWAKGKALEGLGSLSAQRSAAQPPEHEARAGAPGPGLFSPQPQRLQTSRGSPGQGAGLWEGKARSPPHPALDSSNSERGRLSPPGPAQTARTGQGLLPFRPAQLPPSHPPSRSSGPEGRGCSSTEAGMCWKGCRPSACQGPPEQATHCPPGRALSGHGPRARGGWQRCFPAREQSRRRPGTGVAVACLGLLPRGLIPSYLPCWGGGPGLEAGCTAGAW